jgi:hypothetical protein
VDLVVAVLVVVCLASASMLALDSKHKPETRSSVFFLGLEDSVTRWRIWFGQ